MAKHEIADIRNVALVGHGASGKTSLADYVLFKEGVATRVGSVEDGTSLLDVDDDEKERKHTVSAAVCHFTHEGKRINLVDTPGYPDFIGQVVGALRAVENAVVVINATAGIEVNTHRTFQLAAEANLARIVLVDKCDQENIEFERLLGYIQETFGQGCVPLNVPDGLGTAFTSVISILKPSGQPKGVKADVNALNAVLMDAIAEADEELMMRYLDGETLSPEEIAKGVTKALAAGTLIPILFASSKTGVGVDAFVQCLADYALPPTAVKRSATNEAGEVTPIEPDPNGPLVAQVFKTRIDPFVAKMSYVRIYSGTLHKDSQVEVSGHTKLVKIGQLLDVQGGKQEQIESAGPGDLVALVKMDDLHTGDTLRKETHVELPRIEFPRPMVGRAVEPKSRADQTKISSALAKIVEEDPTFKVYRDPQTKEMVMQGMSELHLLMVQDKLAHRDKVEIVTHMPKVPYRETISGRAEGHYRHKKQSGGSGQFAEVHLRVSALPHGIEPEEFFTRDNFEGLRSYHYDPELNFAFIDGVHGGSVPNNFIPAVEKGVKERMEKGIIAGYQVQDIAVELFFGKDHPVDSNETAFKKASSMCLRDVFQKAKPTLLEPIVDLLIRVPANHIGDVTSDLNTRRGRMEGMDEAPGGFTIVKAKAPLAEVMTYTRSLSSLSGGTGSFTMEFSHYDMVPPNEQKKIIEGATHEEEED
jgi:elongation factor G